MLRLLHSVFSNSWEQVDHFISLLVAVALDQAIGEFSVAHPLVGFGSLANLAESRLNKSNKIAPRDQDFQKKQSGIIAVLILIVPFVITTYYIEHSLGPWTWIFDSIVLYFAIGARSLAEHATAVSKALKSGDIHLAQQAVSKIVSRDTSTMQASDATRATIESVLENGNDAIFAPIFWFLLLGAPGAVLLRLSNTLDAMWGYKNSRYLHFGWAAARLDDLLMFVPARLTALSYALCGNLKDGIKCWHSQGTKWYSPNAGPVMAAGAGALRVCLGGNAVYGGTLKERITLGCGREVQNNDIDRANHLLWRTLALWLSATLLGVLLRGLILHD